MCIRDSGVPGRQARDVRWKQVFAGNRDTHLKDAAQKHHVGALRARPVHGRNLEAHVVDDTLRLPLPRGFVERYIRGGHSLILPLTGASLGPLDVLLE